MSWCLRDRTLVWMYYGEATPRHCAHLNDCPVCQTRYRQLVYDLDALRQTLQDAQLPVGVRPRVRAVRVPWLSAAVAVVMLCTVVWGRAWLWRPSPPGQPEVVWHAEVVQFLERDMTLALFATTDTPVAVIPEPVSTSLYLQAALDGGWPCTGQEGFFSPECGEHPFALLVGEP